MQYSAGVPRAGRFFYEMFPGAKGRMNGKRNRWTTRAGQELAIFENHRGRP